MRYIEGIPRDEERIMSFEKMVDQDSIVRLIDEMTQKFYEDNPELLTYPAKGSKHTGRKNLQPNINDGFTGLLLFLGHGRLEKNRKCSTLEY